MGHHGLAAQLCVLSSITTYQTSVMNYECFYTDPSFPFQQGWRLSAQPSSTDLPLPKEA